MTNATNPYTEAEMAIDAQVTLDLFIYAPN